MKTIRLLPLLLGLLLTAIPVFAAGPPPLDALTLDVISRIKTREESLKTFEARFEQIQKSQLFEQIVQSSGIIRYDAGGRLLFQVQEPAPYAVVFDRDWVYIHDPGQQRIKKHHIGQRENILKQYFGVGQPLEDLTRRFDIKATSNKPLPGVTLVMQPRQARLAKRISLISAEVNDGTWLPREIFIQQTQGEWTRMHLDFFSVNQPLPPDAFDLGGEPLGGSSTPTPERKEAP